MSGTVTKLEEARKRILPGVAGRLPPHDLEAEAAVLSAILLKRDALDVVAPILRPESFYGPANGAIYEAAREVAATGTPVDVVTVATWLHDRERLQRVGGAAYLARIIDATPAVSHVEAHARTVRRKARMRSVIAAAHQLAAEGYGDVGDEEEWITAADQRLATIADEEGAGDVVPLGEAVVRAVQTIAASCDDGGAIPGVPTGLTALDRLLGPLKPGRVTTIGGYWGDGKSALGLQIAIAATQAKQRVPSAALIISAEMLADEIGSRSLFQTARVDSSRARNHTLTPVEWRSIHEVGVALHKLPIAIDDRSEISIADLGASVRRRKAMEERAGNELRLVVVDYIQLIEARSCLSRDANREQEVAHVARSLKRIAKECKVHILALAQLNDDANKRAKDERKPCSRDFRESKAIPMNADIVMLIHNPFARERAAMFRDGRSVPAPASELVELIVDKHRGGPTGTVRVTFHPSRTLFVDYEAEEAS